MDVRQEKRNRFKLLLLFGIPFVIMASAYLVYTTGVGVPVGTSNKGVLINPPLQIGDLESLQPRSFPQPDNNLWFFIVPGSGECDAACRQRLYKTRQIRTALGKHTQRIQRIYLNLSGTAPSRELRRFLDSDHADLQVVSAESQQFATMVSAAATPPPAFEQAFYVADPRGFVMLYYNPEHSGKDTLTDMKFLLKYSQE